MARGPARTQPDVAAPSLTVRELINEPGLGLTVIHPGDVGRVIHRAHTIEIANPARWLDAGSAVLTTGLRFAGTAEDPAGQMALVDDLADAGISALLFGVGIHFTTVPPRIVRAARRRDLPLLSVSPEAPFHRIEEFVNRSTVSAGSQRTARVLRLHQALLGALSAADPMTALIGRVATLCKGCAVLYDGSGQPVASAGGGPIRLMWQQISAVPADGPTSFSVGRWRVASRTASLSGAEHHLAIASRDSYLIADVGGDVLDTAEQVLAAAQGLRATQRREEGDEATRLMRLLRSPPARPPALHADDRLRRHGLGSATPMFFVAAIPAMQPESLPRTCTSDLIAKARADGVGILLSDSDDGEPGFHALVSVGERTDDWFRLLSRTHTAGVSAMFTDLASVPAARTEALTARRRVTRRNDSGSTARVLRLDDMDLASWLAAGRPDRDVRARVDRYLAPLADHPGLTETVVMYLACSQDVGAAAERLFVHPNTVRYRLSKVDDLFGGSIRDSASLANLYLALRDDVHAAVRPPSGA